MSIQIITFMGRVPNRVTEPYYILDEFLASCMRYGFTPMILGDKPGEFRGLGSKAKLLKKALYDGTITADRIIVTDSFDVVFSEDPHRVVEEFENIKFTSPASPSLIFNAEKACFSDGSLAPLHPPCNTPWKYLNSGFMLGETEGFKIALEERNPDLLVDDYQDAQGQWHHPCNDQDFWMREFLEGSLSISLDSDCRICQTYFQVEPDEIDLTGDKVRNVITDTFPMVHHWNGPSKSPGGLMEPILKKLQYR